MSLPFDSAALGAEVQKTLALAFAPLPPKLDGTLDDPGWQQAPPQSLSTAEGFQPDLKTTVRLIVSRQDLFVAYECEDTDTNGLRAGVKKRDGPVWSDDCVELFIGTGGTPGYKHFAINSLGQIFDQYCTVSKDGDTSWNSKAKAAAKIESGRWTVELMVPLADLGSDKGDTWRINFNRTRPTRGDQPSQEYSWALLTSKNYHQPEAFGTLTGLEALSAKPSAHGKKPQEEKLGGEESDKDKKPQAEKEPPPDYFEKLYKGYAPPFLRMGGLAQVGFWWSSQTGKISELSTEKTFNSFSMLEEDQRVYALIKAARRFEAQNQTRDALKIYQQVIEQYPNALYRVDPHGIFITAARYCQYRLLALPKSDLEFYRTLYDPRAKEVFEAAQRQYAMIGYQELIDGLLATSYGDDALLALGNAALDNGRFEEALDHFSLIRELFRGGDCNTTALDLKLSYCRRKLGQKDVQDSPGGAKSPLDPAYEARFKKVVAATAAEPEDPAARLIAPPHLAASDYYAFDPVSDTLAAGKSAWSAPLPDPRAHEVYTQPLATGDSIVYKHRNVVYCRSLLNGQERWVCDLGGLLTVQAPAEKAFRMEEILVQGSLAFTNLYKRGFSLVALDLNTGQLRWAAGPMAPTTRQDEGMRYEAAPAAGPRVLYAPYIFDNVEGDSHFDSAYGIRAFEADSGRVLWDQPLCRLTPGKISTNIAVRRKILIRSFCSPPVLHQGTLYHNTQAGAVAALDVRSGRIKWIMRYPYWPHIHDATQSSFIGDHMLANGVGETWYPQRPLVVGNYLFVTPVDSPMLFCIERDTGKVVWAKMKGKDYEGHAGHRYIGPAWLLGPTREGLLVLVYGGRWGPVELIDPNTGKVVWESPDIIKPESSPALTFQIPDGIMLGDERKNRFVLAARPFLTADDKLYVTQESLVLAGQYDAFKGHAYSLSCVALDERRVVEQRISYDATLKAAANWLINEQAPGLLKEPRPEDEKKRYQAIAADTGPRDELGSFMPMSRMSFERFGVPFEVRCGPREISAQFDPDAVKKVLSGREDAESMFLRAEMALAENRLEDSDKLLASCLATVSSNEVDFRARVHLLRYRVGILLTQQAIRRRQAQQERVHAMELAESASSIREEIQSLLALSDSAVRLKNPDSAAACLQDLIRHYRQRPFEIPELAAEDLKVQAFGSVFDALSKHVGEKHYTQEFKRPMEVLLKNLDVYGAAVSPLPHPVTVEAGALASARLMALRAAFPEWSKNFSERAQKTLSAAPPEAQLKLLQEFPGTPAAQTALGRLFAEAQKAKGAERRRRIWELAGTAHIAGLEIPKDIGPELDFPDAQAASAPLAEGLAEKTLAAENEEVLRLLLPRRDPGSLRPELAFLGGRARKRLDNKFELLCVDLRTNKLLWQGTNPEGRSELRLNGAGQEPGFEEVFVTHNLALVHGRFNVRAFALETGKERWHFRAPFGFEIEQVIQAGDLLILSGSAQTLALFIPTASPAGDLVWEASEEGELYVPPWIQGDRLLCVRQAPDGVTARALGTGRLVSRLEISGLSHFMEHPLGPEYPEARPFARRGSRVILTDSWSYICVDTNRMAVEWKRLIDNNDPTRLPPLRFALGEKQLVILKQDYEKAALHGIDAATGALLWHTDPKEKTSPQPLHDFFLEGGKLYGIQSAPRGFRAMELDAATGKQLWTWESKDYKETAESSLLGPLHSGQVVVRVLDGQQCHLLALRPGTKDTVHVLSREGVGPFGVHGRISAEVQDGRLLLWTKNELATAGR